MADTTTPGVAARLETDLKEAMRSGDKVRLAAIRRARGALKNAEIDARGPLDEDAAVKVLRGIAKQHRESIDQFRSGGRDDLVARETEELEALEPYLPAQMDEAAVEAVVDEVIAAEGAGGPKDMGRVMKAVMGRVGAAADGKVVRTIAQRKLGGDR